MKTILAGAICFALCAAQVQAAVQYSYDDGTTEAGVRGGPPRPSDIWVANGFTVQPGGQAITSIEIAFGAPTQNLIDINGLPVTLLLYDDPTNDMDPTDAVLLTSVATTISSANTNTFVSVPITPTLVSGDFFVGALMETPVSGGFITGIDLSNTATVSWVAENIDSGASIDPADVAGTSTLGPITINSLGASQGVLLLRATGVPEPTTLVVAGLLLTGALCRRRHR